MNTYQFTVNTIYNSLKDVSNSFLCTYAMYTSYMLCLTQPI